MVVLGLIVACVHSVVASGMFSINHPASTTPLLTTPPVIRLSSLALSPLSWNTALALLGGGGLGNATGTSFTRSGGGSATSVRNDGR
jgi:hypothetical protein